MTTIKYELFVTGQTWEGAQSECCYPLPADKNQHPKTIVAAKRLAGDFQSLDTAQIIKRTTSVAVEFIPLAFKP